MQESEYCGGTHHVHVYSWAYVDLVKIFEIYVGCFISRVELFVDWEILRKISCNFDY